MLEEVSQLPIIQELMGKQKKCMEAHAERQKAGAISWFTEGPRHSPFVPMIIKKAKGCRFIDLDGNEFIDIAMSYGPLILGHAPDVVVKAVQEAVTLGTSVVVGHELEYKLAKLIIDNVASAERLLFTNSGTEATMQAIKIARASTGREKIAKFEGGYHGTHPDVMVSSNLGTERHGPKDRPEGVLDTPGICRHILNTTLVLPRDNEAAFDIIRENAKELACVILEPMGPGWPKLNIEFLRKLRKVTKDANVLLIFDEVVTGFRTHFGGAQDRWDIVPDMTTFGKIMGGGLPLGAVVGRRDIMEVAVTTGDPREDIKTKVHIVGTNAGNIVSCAAGYAQLGYLKENQDTVYPYLKQQGERLTGAVLEFARKNNMPFRMMGFESAFVSHFLEDDPEDMRQMEKNANAIAEKLLSYYMRRHGVHMPDSHVVFLSTAHRPADVDTLISAFKSSLTDMRKDGFF
ncbi:MAG: aminotransferase class III-fold pyridoxal phosphate-dependent enzyme [Candidatus Lindowbacteria bacterium]|nr:aminotransferase class III-fold pyridoxal phosphate-dependent enzyme [Candidatus Lindowbacteria bacterium]